MPTNERVQELAKILDITPEEVLEMLADDERIDRGEKLFELTPEEQKASKKARQVARSVSTTTTKRERKADTDKGFLVSLLHNALVNSDDERFTETPQIEITNPERQIDFVFNGRKFRIVLSAPRS